MSTKQLLLPGVSAVPFVSFLALISIAFSGCYKSHPCGEAESCDYFDNDCDGKVDEGFLDEDGNYTTLEHCGGCGVACPAVFPTAQETACEVSENQPLCVVVSCPEGFYRAGDGSCAPFVPVLCAPCETDAECSQGRPGSSCVQFETGSRCLEPCDGGGCPAGFSCSSGLCTPDTGLCACTSETIGSEFACLVERDARLSCAGVRRCTEAGLTDCQAALGERCNDIDDDCDGEVDEDFRDDAGRFVDRYNCGECGNPCTEPGPNMVATCEPSGSSAVCNVECREGFVDVDGIRANGCECERFDGDGPPPVAGGDSDCDGQPDVTNDFVYVSVSGSDRNPGTREEPMRTVSGAVARANSEGKDVLVSRGVYEPFEVVGGVSVFGGYRPDFRDRDVTLFPVVFERVGASSLPIITCTNVREATRLEGFEVRANDSTAPGVGSTAVRFDRCGPEVTVNAVTIFAGRGAAGVSGLSASERYAMAVGGTLAELDGRDGTSGAGALGGFCSPIAGGAGGGHSCRLTGQNVSGGAGGNAECPSLGCTNGAPCGNAGCTDFTVGGVCDLDAARAAATANPSATGGRGPGAGEAGADTYNAPTNRGVCNFCDDNPTLPRTGVRGGDGQSGFSGDGGIGCGQAIVFDSTTGLLRGGNGGDGTGGTDGGGGGGGSPGSGYAVIGGTAGSCEDRSGGAGGGGGSGGCGAPAGFGGTGGGASIGVVLNLAGDTGPTFESLRVVTASGGAGGDGGNGASGGRAGVGANGGATNFWCSRTGGRGGDGGAGGAGGGGGGGCGGASYGFFVVGDPSSSYRTSLNALDVAAVGVAGPAGRGGVSPGASGVDGVAGQQAPLFVVPSL